MYSFKIKKDTGTKFILIYRELAAEIDRLKSIISE